MTSAVCVLDAGPSSVRFALYDAATRLPRIKGRVEAIGTAPRFVAQDPLETVLDDKAWPPGTRLGHEGAVDHIVGYLRSTLGPRPLAGFGHRVAHGGVAHDKPVRVDAGILADLETLVPLAPREQPHDLAPIRRLLQRAPEIPQVACFDTAFHRTQPQIAQMYALPRELHDRGVRRFGFDGLVCEHVAALLPQVDPEAARGRAIVLHLGECASMCALQGGHSVASTSGFGALDGLVMGTRSGTIDPGALLFLMRTRKLDADAVEELLADRSGLLGVSRLSGDMRTLLASRDPLARLAIDLYVYRIRRELGGLAGIMGGLDAVVFTGGIGENSAEIRARVLRDAQWLGVELDEAANAARARRVSAPGSRVRAWRLEGDEDGVIAGHTLALTGTESAAGLPGA